MIKEISNNELFIELERNKDKESKIYEILNEIDRRINEKSVSFNMNYNEYLYLYLFVCNKYDHPSSLKKLLNDEKFIKALDKTDMSGSMIIALTNFLKRPRTLLLRKCKKIEESFTKGDELFCRCDILEDLTNEEISILRENQKIDNYLISSGLSFDTIKDDLRNRLLREPKLLTTYKIETISAFTNSCNNLNELARNEEYLNIYISKLTDEYHYNNFIFNFIDKNTLNYILSVTKEDHVLLHLVKDTKKQIQSILLADKKVVDLLYNCDDYNVLRTIPGNLIEKIIESKKHKLVSPYRELINLLPKKSIERLYEKGMYEEFINCLKEGIDINLNLPLLVHSLSTKSLKDLSENQIINFDLNTLGDLYLINPILFKSNILKNKKLCSRIIKDTTIKNFNNLEEFINKIELSDEEKTKFILNCDEFKNREVLIRLINLVSPTTRSALYENKNIRELVVKDNTEFDDYLIKRLLNNFDDIKLLSNTNYLKLLNEVDNEARHTILSDDYLLVKLFKENENEFKNLKELLKNHKDVLPFYNKDIIFPYYTPENINAILSVLTIKEKNQFYTSKILNMLIGDDEETIKKYRHLQSRNAYLLNTLSFNFLKYFKDPIKTSVLDEILLYPELQNNIVEIHDKFKIKGSTINMVASYLEDLSLNPTIIDLTKLFKDSVNGNNRKTIGNIPKLLNIMNIDELTRENINDITNYLLYIIPRYYKDHKERVSRLRVIATPNSYNEIKDYENNTNSELERRILKGENVLENFVFRHFKLSLEEAYIMSNMYRLNDVDENIYKDEYNYLNNLNKILNTDINSLKEMTKTYKIYSMRESFAIENKIRMMYAKIYNYQVKTLSFTNKLITYKLYGKDVKVYEANKEFMFIVNKLDLKEELDKTNSYIEAWHNTVNKSDCVLTSLISNENLKVYDDIVFGFNGILDKGIVKMSNESICEHCMNNTKQVFALPAYMIDNTRDENTIAIDKYAVRPNYNNANLPNIEPDYILVNSKKISDHTYLEKAVRASEDFKTKRNKNGLPIIAINYDKVIDNELKTIKKEIDRYNKTHDMNTLKNILIRFENNYVSYYNTEYQDSFDIRMIIDLLYNRLKTSNSVKELEYLRDVFEEEYNKFQSIPCNYDIKLITDKINRQIDTLNNN